MCHCVSRGGGFGAEHEVGYGWESVNQSPKLRQNLLLRIEIEVGGVSFAPLPGEDDGLSTLGGRGYEPAG